MKKSLQLWKKVVVCMDNNDFFCSFSCSVRGPLLWSYVIANKKLRRVCMIFHNCSQQNTQYMLLNIRQVVVHIFFEMRYEIHFIHVYGTSFKYSYRFWCLISWNHWNVQAIIGIGNIVIASFTITKYDLVISQGHSSIMRFILIYSYAFLA